jgi:TolB-like protein
MTDGDGNGIGGMVAAILRILVLTFLLGGMASCSLREPPAVLKLAELPDGGNICRIAILPFINQSEYSQADDIFGRVFASELINAGNYQVAQEGDVRRFFKQLQILPNQLPNIEQLRALADRLEAQIVISGVIVEMRDKNKYDRRLDPAVTVILRIIEGDSGRTLWATYHRREGNQYRKTMHFGLVNTVAALAKRVSGEIASSWQKEGLLKCSAD